MNLIPIHSRVTPTYNHIINPDFKIKVVCLKTKPSFHIKNHFLHSFALSLF